MFFENHSAVNKNRCEKRFKSVKVEMKIYTFWHSVLGSLQINVWQNSSLKLLEFMQCFDISFSVLPLLSTNAILECRLDRSTVGPSTNCVPVSFRKFLPNCQKIRIFVSFVRKKNIFSRLLVDNFYWKEKNWGRK